MKASKVLQKVGLALGRTKKNPNDYDDDESFSDESGSEDDDSLLSDSDNAASDDYYSSSYDDDDESVFSESTGGYTATTPTAPRSRCCRESIWRPPAGSAFC